MRVLAMASQKGGSGKTTLSGHLAVQAQLAGARPRRADRHRSAGVAVRLVERARRRNIPAFAQTTVARLAADLEVLRQQGFKLAMIDTPPAITLAIQSVIQVAELIVVPTRPSPARPARGRRHGRSVRARRQAADLRRQRRDAQGADHVGSRGRAVAARHRRADHDPPAHRFRRVDDRRPHGDGGRSRTASRRREVAQLWTYISDRLEKNFRRTVFSVPTAHGGRLRHAGAARSACQSAKPSRRCRRGSRAGAARPRCARVRWPAAGWDLGWNDMGSPEPRSAVLVLRTELGRDRACTGRPVTRADRPRPRAHRQRRRAASRSGSTQRHLARLAARCAPEAERDARRSTGSRNMQVDASRDAAESDAPRRWRRRLRQRSGAPRANRRRPIGERSRCWPAGMEVSCTAAGVRSAEYRQLLRKLSQAGASPRPQA